MTIEQVGQALASFERVIVTGPSAYDFAEGVRAYEKLTKEDLADLKDDDAAGPSTKRLRLRRRLIH